MTVNNIIIFFQRSPTPILSNLTVVFCGQVQSDPHSLTSDNKSFSLSSSEPLEIIIVDTNVKPTFELVNPPT